jgi:long-chain acyl-CoA synthetase
LYTTITQVRPAYTGIFEAEYGEEEVLAMKLREQATEVVRHNLKKITGRTAAPKRDGKLHEPSVITTEPRTDVPAELAARKPWVRFYQHNVPLDIEVANETLPQMFRTTVRQHGEKDALVFFGHKISYRELDDASEAFAAGLAAQGVKKGDRVALLLPNCPHFVIAYYGAQKIGAIIVPCNPTYTEKELVTQLNDSKPSAFVTLSVLFKLARTVQQKVGISHLIVGNIKDYFPPALKLVFTVAKEKKEGHRVELEGAGVHSWSEFLAKYASHKAPTVEISPDDIALYQYTGGTTGVPKGAMLSHRNLTTNTRQGAAWMGADQKGVDVTLCAVPFFHVYGMTVAMNLSVYVAGSMVLMPRFVPGDVLKAIDRYRPTLFPGVPAMYIALLNHPDVSKYDLSSIEACMSGAAPLPVEVQEKFEKLTGAKLIEGFGMTELSPISMGNPLYGRRKEGSIGLPMPGVDAKIVDLETGDTDLPVGEVGELVVSGPMVMQGYYNRPEETAKTIRDGWLYTGDIAKMDDDGYFFIVDRKKDMILSNGFNVYPRDVEEVLYQHPAVQEAVVAGVPNERGDDTVKAFIVLKEGATATPEEIIKFCRESLTAYKAPRSVEFRESLPKTLIGKHLRRVLVEEEKAKLAAKKSGVSAATTEQPSTETKPASAATPSSPVDKVKHTAQGLLHKAQKLMPFGSK